MAKELNHPAVEYLVAALRPVDPTRDGPEARKRKLEALCTLFQVWVRSPDDFFDAGGQLPEEVREFANAGRAQKMRRMLQRSNVSSLGLHIVDPVCGRISRIWTTERWARESRDLDSSGWREREWVIGHVWMKSYWQLLRTNSTLINALHDGSLGTLGQPIEVAWNGASPRRSCIKLPTRDPFLVSSRRLAQQFAEVVVRHADQGLTAVGPMLRDWSGQPVLTRSSDDERDAYHRAVDTAVGAIARELRESCFVAQTGEVCADLRRRVLRDTDVRESFLATLRAVEGRESDLAKLVGAWSDSCPEVRHEDSWREVLSVCEALQSCVMNEAIWAGESGFIIDRSHGGGVGGPDTVTVYVVVGFSAAIDTRARRAARELIGDVMRAVVPIQQQIAGGLDGRSDDRPRELVAHLCRVLDPADARPDKAGMKRWLHCVCELAARAVSEGRELTFLLGWGPAFLTQTQLRRFERAPTELTPPTVASAKVALFLKSYFSLFGRTDRIAWCDPSGSFMGVYDRVGTETVGDWFAGWGPVGRARDYFVARVLGRDRFELLDGEGKLRARVVDGRMVEDAAPEALTAAIGDAVERMAPGNAALRTLGQTVTRLFEGWMRGDHGTGLLVYLADTDVSGEEWRAPFRAQIRALAPVLERLRPPILDLEIDALGDKSIDRIVEVVAPLGQLDGATVLRVDSGALFKGRLVVHCLPAHQAVPVVPLANRDAADRTWGALDFRSWAQGATAQDGLTLPADATRLEEGEARFVVGTLVGTSDPSAASEAAQAWLRELDFLQSAGTRHHSLWGISLTAREPSMAVTLSNDGPMKVFWDGRSLLPERARGGS